MDIVILLMVTIKLQLVYDVSVVAQSYAPMGVHGVNGMLLWYVFYYIA